MYVCVYSFKRGVSVDKHPAAAVTSWKHRGALSVRAVLQNVPHMQQVQNITCRDPHFLLVIL